MSAYAACAQADINPIRKPTEDRSRLAARGGDGRRLKSDGNSATANGLRPGVMPCERTADG